jgi:hypothetical protein
MNYRFNEIDSYLEFLNSQCTRVPKSAIVPSECYSYVYEFARDEYKGVDFSEWDLLPCSIVGSYYTADSNGAEGFFGINLHHLPITFRMALISGKSLSDKHTKEAIRRYRYTGLVSHIWFIPDAVRHIVAMFHPNTYEHSSYNARFGKAPTLQQVQKKFPRYYWDAENSSPQFK